MKKHTKVYMDHFGFTIADFIPCEICGAKAVDVHHIVNRGMGGTELKDSIHNLMALCRYDHIKYGDKKHYIEMLIQVHQEKLKQYV